MREEFRSILKEWIIPLLIAFVLVAIVKHFIYEPFKVHGTSMYPTLEGEEIIIVNKWKYRIGDPHRGDIVVFHTNEHKDFIKRVIGIEGDKIQVKNGCVYRNEKRLDESYIEEPTFTFRREDETVVVGSGEFYVLGDNRPHSKDSRIIGLVKRGDIVGRADAIIFPFNEMLMLHSSV